MLYDANGRPFNSDSLRKVEDPTDGYTPEYRTTAAALGLTDL